MEIRRVRPDELAAVGDLTVAAYDVDGYAEPTYVDRLRDTAARVREAEVWVAVGDDGVVLGCVTYCPPGSPWREIATDDSEGEFRMLAVSPAARRRGIARQLVQLCVDRSRALGQPRLVLCSEKRMLNAQQLYAPSGSSGCPTATGARSPASTCSRTRSTSDEPPPRRMS